MNNEWVIILIGMIFGLLISYASLNKYNTIAGLSVLRNLTVAKTIMLVLGIGSLLLIPEFMNGLAVYHVKPFYMIGTILGGLIFGVGMSILGYCPGTLPISVGQGAIDALLGVIGGVIGGVVFTLLYPYILPLLGDDLGKMTLFTLMGGKYSIAYIFVMIIISFILIFGAFVLHSIDIKQGNSSKKWIVTGIGLALLNAILFYQGWQNRPLGASSCYPFVGDTILNIEHNAYYPSLIASGNWQLWFLFGAFLAGFIYAIFTQTFRFHVTQELWEEYKGTGKAKRIAYALLGGFILIFGARMADGCTSGHIISGGMQFAISSYVFAIATFIGFLTTGHLFYKKKK